MRAVPGLFLLLSVALSSRPAHSNPLVDHAAEASRDGNHAQAVADLRRAAISVLTPPNDGEMTRALDRAHGEWLVALARTVASAKPVEQLGTIRVLLEEAARLNSQHAGSLLVPMRDALALQLRGMTVTGELEMNLQIARKLQLTAGPGSPLDARVTELEAEVEALAGRLSEPDADVAYLRDQVRSYYRLVAPPAHPRPIQARWRLDAAASSCDDVVAATRELLSGTAGSDEIAASLAVTGCAQTEQRGRRRDDRTWWETVKVPKTERSFRTVKETINERVVNRVCRPVYESAGTSASSTTVTTYYYSYKSECHDEVSTRPREVSREIMDERVTEETTQVARTEQVDVTTRETRLAVTLALTATVNGRSFRFQTALVASHDDEQFSSQHVGSESFDDPRPVLRADIAAQLAAQLADFGRISVRGARITGLQEQLANTPGPQRLPIVRALAVEQGAALPELVDAIAATTTLPRASVEKALAGQRLDAMMPFAGAVISLELPAPDKDALEDLYADEERALMPGGGGGGGATFGLARMSSATNSGYGATVALHGNATPRALLFRTARLGLVYEGQLAILSGNGGYANVEAQASVGASAGLQLGPVAFDVVGVVGGGGLKAFDGDDVMISDGDPRVPFSVFYGYGVNLKISGDVRSLAIVVRRLERRDDAVPELWIGEARWAKKWWFVGARVEAYRELLASDPAPGPWIVGLTIGALWTATDAKVGQFVGYGAHTR